MRRRMPYSENGQTILEYALIIGGISVVMAALLAGFGADLIADTQARVLELIP